jgi:hypothetical protein
LAWQKAALAMESVARLRSWSGFVAGAEAATFVGVGSDHLSS